MNAHELNVSVIDPIGPAIEKVKTILFRPFDLGKWFTIGFCAWLAFLGKGGGGGGGGGHGGGRGGGPSNAREAFGQAKGFVLENLSWIIPVAITVVVFIIVLWLVFTWLSSRGRFMFLHCVAENKAEVIIPWGKFRQHANSLFLFRIALGLINLAVMVLPVVLVIFVVIALANTGVQAGLVLALVAIGLFAFVTSICFAIVYKFTTDFVVPIMFLRSTSCKAAWREFISLLSANKGRFILYILFQILIAIVIGTIEMLGFCIGCCLCCVSVLLLIPYIGTVILLPLLVFERSYSLCYFRQFGPEFDVFRPEIEPA